MAPQTYLYVTWHPEPKSFNASATKAAVKALEEAGHTVLLSDLNAMGWDPVSSRKNFVAIKDAEYFKPQVEEMHAHETDGFVPDVAAEQEKLRRADVVVFQFPLWWFSMPAALKGWLDRVLAMGFAYGWGRIFDKGVFQGKRAVVAVSTGGPAESYSAESTWSGDINETLRVMHRGIFAFLGMETLRPEVFFGVAHVTDEERQGLIDGWARRVVTLSQEEPIPVPPLRLPEGLKSQLDEHRARMTA